MTDEKVLLRLSQDTLAVYRALVSLGDFPTVAEAVRTVLEDYADEKISEGVSPMYDVEEVIDIEDLTPDGRSLDDMVRSAARRYMDYRSGE